jgi:hypothetical protein
MISRGMKFIKPDNEVGKIIGKCRSLWNSIHTSPLIPTLRLGLLNASPSGFPLMIQSQAMNMKMRRFGIEKFRRAEGPAMNRPDRKVKIKGAGMN